MKYLLGTVLSAYRDFEDRFTIVEEILPAVDIIRKAVHSRIGKFTKQGIREMCPILSISSVEGSLGKLVSAGELRLEGAGKATFYIRFV